MRSFSFCHCVSGEDIKGSRREKYTYSCFGECLSEEGVPNIIIPKSPTSSICVCIFGPRPRRRKSCLSEGAAGVEGCDINSRR